MMHGLANVKFIKFVLVISYEISGVLQFRLQFGKHFFFGKS
jgi:hypothetical protein